MTGVPSRRISDFVRALPLRSGMRVLEIGCGPGVAARLAAMRVDPGHVLAIDRSERAIEQARNGSAILMSAGILEFRHSAAEDFQLAEGEAPYDLAFAMRIGALDGRHPEAGRIALARISAALTLSGKLFIDGGDPLQEIHLSR